MARGPARWRVGRALPDVAAHRTRRPDRAGQGANGPARGRIRADCLDGRRDPTPATLDEGRCRGVARASGPWQALRWTDSRGFVLSCATRSSARSGTRPLVDGEDGLPTRERCIAAQSRIACRVGDLGVFARYAPRSCAVGATARRPAGSRAARRLTPSPAGSPGDRSGCVHAGRGVRRGTRRP